jgi:hypothetical protein
MRISRTFTVEDWKALDLNVEESWDSAVDMFKDRLETRYLEHIRRLLPMKTSGFAVLALDCALIETIENFKRGTKTTPGGKGREYFVSFLTSSKFAEHFTADRAAIFYTQIRCGLLHQSEAGELSRIKRGGNLPLVSDTTDKKSLILNKVLFHDLLEEEIRLYYANLRSGATPKLRLNFRKKMDGICRIQGSVTEGAA